MAGLQTEATEARMARFVAGVQALGTALSHPLDTAGAMVTGVRRGLGRYLDDLANGREEAAARSAAKVIGTIELGIATGGLGAQALKAASAPLAGAARHIGRAVSSAAAQTRRALANVPTRVGEALRRPGRAVESVEKVVDDGVGVGDVGREVASTGRLPPASGTYGELRVAGLKDGHHIIQDAAVRELPGYNRTKAPAVHLEGPSTRRGTPHYEATRVQGQRGGGTYAAERRIGYKAMRRAGISEEHARFLIEAADDYFRSLGVTASTPTRVPGNRR
jgi:hypothetical protein